MYKIAVKLTCVIFLFCSMVHAAPKGDTNGFLPDVQAALKVAEERLAVLQTSKNVHDYYIYLESMQRLLFEAREDKKVTSNHYDVWKKELSTYENLYLKGHYKESVIPRLPPEVRKQLDIVETQRSQVDKSVEAKVASGDFDFYFYDMEQLISLSIADKRVPRYLVEGWKKDLDHFKKVKTSILIGEDVGNLVGDLDAVSVLRPVSDTVKQLQEFGDIAYRDLRSSNSETDFKVYVNIMKQYIAAAEKDPAVTKDYVKEIRANLRNVEKQYKKGEFAQTR